MIGLTKANIEKITEKILQKYQTVNPFELCAYKGIEVVHQTMPISLKGYTTEYNRIKMILLNNKNTDQENYFTCCHELGHIFLKHNDNIFFYEKRTLHITNREETEADHFAIALILKKYEDEDTKDLTIDQLSRLTGIPQSKLQVYYNFF